MTDKFGHTNNWIEILLVRMTNFNDKQKQGNLTQKLLFHVLSCIGITELIFSNHVRTEAQFVNKHQKKMSRTFTHRNHRMSRPVYSYTCNELFTFSQDIVINDVSYTLLSQLNQQNYQLIRLIWNIINIQSSTAYEDLQVYLSCENESK